MADAVKIIRGRFESLSVDVFRPPNALDQHAAAGDADSRKRMTGGYVASNCYVVPFPRNYFRQNADLVTCVYCFCRQIADTV